MVCGLSIRSCLPACLGHSLDYMRRTSHMCVCVSVYWIRFAFVGFGCFQIVAAHFSERIFLARIEMSGGAMEVASTLMIAGCPSRRRGEEIVLEEKWRSWCRWGGEIDRDDDNDNDDGDDGDDVDDYEICGCVFRSIVCRSVVALSRAGMEKIRRGRTDGHWTWPSCTCRRVVVIIVTVRQIISPTMIINDLGQFFVVEKYDDRRSFRTNFTRVIRASSKRKKRGTAASSVSEKTIGWSGSFVEEENCSLVTASAAARTAVCYINVRVRDDDGELRRRERKNVVI